MAMARPQCTLLLCLFSIVPVVAARPRPPVVPVTAARPPVVPVAAARPPPASACAGTGVEPVGLSRPLAFCGGKKGEPSCCDAANDTTISLAFANSSVSRPSTHDADAAACAAALLKRRLCAVCFPDTSLAAPCAEQPEPAPSPASVVGTVIGSLLGAVGAVLLAWYIWKKMQDEGCSCSCSTDSCSTVCSCYCCNNTTIWCC